MVKGFDDAKNFTATPIDQDKSTEAPSGEAGRPQSNSNREVQEDLPQSAAARVMGADKE